MKKNTIVITGANGYLGGKITRALLESTCFDILALASSEEKFQEMVSREKITPNEKLHFLSNQDFFSRDLSPQGLFLCIHLAFSRHGRPAEDIAGSIDFSSRLFAKLKSDRVERIINISTQGVYGDVCEFRLESMKPAPTLPYTVAKYAAEILLRDCRVFKKGCYTSLRLDYVIQSQNLVKALCKQAKTGKINLVGGKQQFSYLDADDVATGVLALILREADWNPVYNLGWNRQRYTLVELSQIVAEVADAKGYPRPEIILETRDIMLWAGMDSSAFMEHTGWKPRYSMREMVERIFDMS